MNSIRLFFLGLALLLVPAGKLSTLTVAGRSPDLFYLDIAMFFAAMFTGFGLMGITLLWKAKWRMLIVFLVVVLAGGFLSADGLSFVALLRPIFYSYVSIVIVTRGIRSPLQVNILLAALCLGCFGIFLDLSSVLGVDGIAALSDKTEVELNWGRSNYFATFALVSFFVSVGLYRGGCGFWFRSLGLICAVASVVLLLEAKSRAAMLIFALVLFAGIPLWRGGADRASGKFSWSALFWVIAGLLVVAGAFPIILSLIGADPDVFIDSGNLKRIDAWLSALNAFIGSPIIGIGWSNTTALVESLTESGTTTHSLPLQLLAETGLLGFVSFAMVLVSVLGRSGKFPKVSLDYRLRNGVRLAVLAALGHCLVEPSFWGTSFSVVIWTCIGILHCSKQDIGRVSRVSSTRNDSCQMPLRQEGVMP